MTAHLTEAQSKFHQTVDMAMMQVKTQMQSEVKTVVEEAKKEFMNNQTAMSLLTNCIGEVERRVAAGGGAGDRTGVAPPGERERSIFPAKLLMPSKYADQQERWATWAEDAKIYLDVCIPGLKEVLKAVENQDQAVTIQWVEDKAGPQLAGKAKEVLNGLRMMTEEGSTARRTVASVPEDNGYEAWRRLSIKFGLPLQVRQSLAQSELMSMAGRQARTPEETKELIAELERRVHNAVETMNVSPTVFEITTTGILEAGMDVETKKHIRPWLGQCDVVQERKADRGQQHCEQEAATHC